MRKVLRILLLIGAATATAVSAHSQAVATTSHEVNTAISYNTQHSNLTTGDGFWLQGGAVDVSAEIHQGLSVVVSISGAHAGNILGSGVSLTTIDALAGPRYRWTPISHKYAFFGQALIGEAHGRNSLFPAQQGAVSSYDSFALQTGGGVDLWFSRRVAIRLIEMDWLRTQFPNSTTNVQNNLRISAGLVFRIN